VSRILRLEGHSLLVSFWQRHGCQTTSAKRRSKSQVERFTAILKTLHSPGRMGQRPERGGSNEDRPCTKYNTPDTQLRASSSPFLVRYCIPVEKCHRLIFSFDVSPAMPPNAQPRMRLSGFGYDGKSIGLLNRQSCYLSVQSLQGLRLARDNFGCFTAFQIKDGQSGLNGRLHLSSVSMFWSSSGIALRRVRSFIIKFFI
jgi:hypothetical protein